eukprot:13297748-Ditylum_brightwellii.AAC.1
MEFTNCKSMLSAKQVVIPFQWLEPRKLEQYNEVPKEWMKFFQGLEFILRHQNVIMGSPSYTATKTLFR